VILRKERRSGRHHVAAVEWVSGEGQAMRGVFSLTLDDSGQWECRGCHSGSWGGDPVRGRPWVNVGAGGDPFYVGGRVVESDVAVLVRIRFSNGSVLEDVAGPDGIVIFPVERNASRTDAPSDEGTRVRPSWRVTLRLDLVRSRMTHQE
jgi:hypothetical protein